MRSGDIQAPRPWQPVAFGMLVEVAICRDEIPAFVDGVNPDGEQVVQVVGGRRQLLLRPRAGEDGSLQHQELYLVAFPGQRAAVVRPVGEERVDETPFDCSAVGNSSLGSG